MAGFLVGLNINDVAAETFSGNASTTAFTLAVAGTTNTCGVYILGVHQVPTTDYSVSGTTLTFTAAPPTGTNNVCVVYTKPQTVGAPADATVTTAKLSGDLTLPGKITAAGDTAASDNASMGYTSAEGLILTGQGSTNDVTIKNDADADVITIATGGTAVDVVGALTAGTVTSDAGVAGTTGIFSSDVTGLTINATGDTAASDNAAIGYTSAEGLILTGQGSTNDVTIKNDADADVMTIATGTTTVGFADGAVATPSITNIGDLNTGIYFPAADTVGIVAGGTEQFRFGSNLIAGGSKNLIMNGGMNVNQRYGDTDSGLGGANAYLEPDRWRIEWNSGSAARYTINVQPNGGVNGKSDWLKVDVTTADTSPTGNEYQIIHQRIEAQNCLSLLDSSSDFKAFTVSFDIIINGDGTGVEASNPKLACFIENPDGNRTYVKDVTVASGQAASWERVSFTVPADATAIVNNDNGVGLSVGITLAAGSSDNATDATWVGGTGGDHSTSSSINVGYHTSNYLGITNFQLEVGSVATDYEYEDFGTTLKKCQRYFERVGNFAQYVKFGEGHMASANTIYASFGWETTKRAAPTFSKNGTLTCNVFSGTSGSTANFYYPSPFRGQVEISGGSGLTGGQAATLQVSNGVGDYIQIDAEL